MSSFDFATAFASSDFILCGHGDGRGTDHVHGWTALAARVEEDCGVVLRDFAEEWQWSDERVSQPFFLALSFEAEGLSIVRLSGQAVRSIQDKAIDDVLSACKAYRLSNRQQLVTAIEKMKTAAPTPLVTPHIGDAP